VLTSKPDELLSAWRKRDTTMFGDAPPGQVDEFLKERGAVRVWYSIESYDRNGELLGTEYSTGIKWNNWADATRLENSTVRGIAAVIVLIDARLAKGISFGQLAAYVSMVSLAQLRMTQHLGEAPTILHLFADDGVKAPPGLSPWDESFLKALYSTRHTDNTQAAAIKSAMFNEIVQ
jgi:hypothetical protein